MSDLIPSDESFFAPQYQDIDGKEVSNYEKSWAYRVLQSQMELAHDLMSGRVVELAGDVKVIENKDGSATHIVAPNGYGKLRCVLMFNNKNILERVLIAHDDFEAPIIEIPPPLAVNVMLENVP